METLQKADIFFFITSIAIIVITLALLLLIWKIYKILEQAQELIRTTQQVVTSPTRAAGRLLRIVSSWLRHD